MDSRDIALSCIAAVFPNAKTSWSRINYGHRDGHRLKLNVIETTSRTVVASVLQDKLDPDGDSSGAKEIKTNLEALKQDLEKQN